jgi:hypothetical protein
MATKYWFGGNGNYNSGTDHWSLNSGNSPASLTTTPTAADDVVFDSASATGNYTVTIEANAAAKNVSFAQPSGGTVTLTGTGGFRWDIYGNCTLVSGMVNSFLGSITFRANATLTTNTVALYSVGINADFTTLTLGDNLRLIGSSASQINNTKGILNTAGYKITSSTNISCTSTSAYFILNNSEIICTNFSIQSTTASAVSAGTSVIILSGSSQSVAVPTNTQLYNVTCSMGGTKTFSGNPKMNRLHIYGTAAANVVSISDSISVSDTLILSGNSNIDRLYVKSGTSNSSVIISAQNYTCNACDFEDISAATTWILSGATNYSGDCGGNSNIIFTPAISAYWKHGGTASVQYSLAANWYNATNGGGGAARIPLVQDTAIFDASSFAATGKTVGFSAGPVRIGRVYWNPNYNNTLTTNVGMRCYGSFNIIKNCILTASTNAWIFCGKNGSYSFSTSGVSWAKNLTFDSSNGTYDLNADLTTTAARTVAIGNGTFNTNNYVITAGLLTVASNTTLSLGNATHILNGTGTVLNISDTANISQGTSTLKLIYSGTGAITCSLGSHDYYNFWNATTDSTVVTIDGVNTFNDFKIDAGRTMKFTNSTTQTFNTFTAVGTAISGIVLSNSSSTTQATLAKAGGGTVMCDYLTVTNLIGSPSLTWYAGSHSIDGGNNTYIYFNDGPITTTFNGNFLMFFY